MSKKGISRRTFLARTLGAAGLVAAGSWFSWRWLRTQKPAAIAGSILGANAKVGHLLRKASQLPITKEIETQFLIIGGGIAGLSAGWRLQKNGISDFKILELADKAGGNSVHGQNEVSRYPWGAHYLPIPEINNQDLRTLCEELGLIEGYDKQGLPIYNALHLCHSPHERLLIHGSWQDGLVPKLGIEGAEAQELEAFFVEMEKMKNWIGKDQLPAFTIPLARSSQDPEILALDRISMSDFLAQKGWTSPALHWYVNYGCRDDYGAPYTEISAWAGIHYFAARRGQAANANSTAVLTWPEGNGWLANQLASRVQNQLQCQALVTELRNTESGIEAVYYDTRTAERIRVKAKAAIYAAPHFTVPYVIAEASSNVASNFNYAPWLVANVTLRKRPRGPGARLSWDNVAFESKSLGYIIADHQSLKRKRPDQTVLTWYQPLDEQRPAEARKKALTTSWETWRDRVIEDLEFMHPGITPDILQIDVWVWAHGMISPQVNFLWHGNREKAAQTLGNIHFAHSDLSGISIFEEAFYQGVRAADQLI